LKNKRVEMNANEQVAIPTWKRALDIVLIVAALPILLPLAILIALLIHKASPGPILFQQERVGFRGRGFMCLKFRTMHCGAETRTHQGHLQDLMTSDAPMTKMDAKGDSRIISGGRILRSSGLDELPQLLNVLKGDMSLVGPRPCIPYEATQYLPWQRERFNTAPGLTGLWQVNGKNKTTFTRMMQLDIEYSRKRSIWLDLKIILMTPVALFIQMRDMRHSKKISASPVSSDAVIPARVTNH
jgi:lipopolysaccharide/colanic/teichoic acid biosynthesis glycosyltransferase